jgi:hypothetical protein
MPPDTAERRPAGGGVPDDTRGGGTSDSSLQSATASGRDWRKLWRFALHQALRRSGDRRTRVLRHPDLAELLTRPEVGYSDPRQWTGYVPPELWNGRPNDSPRRAALVAIATEAMQRETGPAAIEPT